MIRLRRHSFWAIAAAQATVSAGFLFVRHLASSATPSDGTGDFEISSYWNGWIGILFSLGVPLWALGIAAARLSLPATPEGASPRMLASAYAVAVPAIIALLLLVV
jgi:hypothetical protein